MPPYNFVSYEPLQAAPYADQPGGKDVPVAAEDHEEDDDMEMSPG